MIPEWGYFCLVLALTLALAQTLFPLFGIWRARDNTINSWMLLAKPAAYGQLLFLLLSFACLVYAFVSNDFSVNYVAQNSNTQLPLFYKVGAVWGAHEGSLLLWVTILGLWTALIARFNSRMPPEMLALVLVVLGFISIGFLLFLLMTSNPFARLLPDFPLQGADLNPLLQDPGLVIHPPMLYMGYVGFAVAFAFAVAALIYGKMDAAWARWMRPWTLAAWCFLTLGITLGSGWAYRVLGWGGWWFWDPVENASFLPWLTGTALIHSLIVAEKRGAFRSWTILLAICAFSLSLIGTFLVRSGVLVSVHAFANDPARGKFLLLFLAVVIGCALFLYAVRANSIRTHIYFSLLSRESFLLANNVVLIIAMTTILLGTVYPMILDALGLGQISIGAPYFNRVFVPLMVPLLLLMGVGPFCYWRQMNGKILLKQLWLPFFLSIVVSGFLLLIFTGTLSGIVLLGVILAIWIIVMTIKVLIKNPSKIILRKQIGMAFAHVGVAVCVMGITLVSHYKLERHVIMKPGDTVALAGYTFLFADIYDLQGPNYKGVGTDFVVSKNNKEITVLHAQKRIYNAQKIVDTRAGIAAGIFRDLYVSLGDPLNDNTWAVRIYYEPFVRWIWCGGLLMLLGGILAIRQARTIDERSVRQ